MGSSPSCQKETYLPEPTTCNKRVSHHLTEKNMPLISSFFVFKIYYRTNCEITYKYNRPYYCIPYPSTHFSLSARNTQGERKCGFFPPSTLSATSGLRPFSPCLPGVALAKPGSDFYFCPKDKNKNCVEGYGE